MRQETGSNTQPHKQIVSIRITSSGDNFSQLCHPTQGEVTLLCESPKAMLLPTPLLEQRSLEGHLLAAGIAVDPYTEDVEIINYDDHITALIALPTTLLTRIDESYGNRAHLWTPLLAPAPARGNTLLVHLSTDNTLLTLTLYNANTLIFAEIFEIGGVSDTLYWVSQLNEGYNLNRYTIYIDGVDISNPHIGETRRLLSKYYNQVL